MKEISNMQMGLTSRGLLRNAMTIDVEDYFQVSALAPYIQRSDWDSRECRIERNIESILSLLVALGPAKRAE